MTHDICNPAVANPAAEARGAAVRFLIDSIPLKPWPVYVLATLVTFATLGLRIALDGPLGGRPTLVIFTMPIMLSAYLGGLRAGLLATGLSYLLASYYGCIHYKQGYGSRLTEARSSSCRSCRVSMGLTR